MVLAQIVPESRQSRMQYLARRVPLCTDERLEFQPCLAMINPVRLIVVFAGASALSVAALAYAGADNTLEIVIGGGPNAGTYKPPASATSCIHFKQQKQFTAVFKDFDASDLSKVGEAGLNVLNPDDPGPRRGAVLVAFGARADTRALRYSISIPGDSAGPITLSRNGKTADLAFQGKTKDGISIRVTARCLDVEEF